MAEEITYFRFMSEVRAFLAKLLKNPIDAQPSKYLKNRGVSRKWLIDNLIKRDVLERHEKILDPTNSDEKKAKYVVKFKVRKKDFEKRIYKIYVKKFENNVNESVEEMQAWHGSMNSFDAFDENHVSDGAGAQLKGWGTYVATDRATGEHYCQRFSRDTNQTYLYEVQIPDDNGNNYLNFEGNRPEVYDWIYKVLVKAHPKCKSYLNVRIQSCKQQDCLEQICYSLPGLPVDEISKTLDRNGIVGIRYKNSNGGFNYCIFRAANVRIVNRNQYGMNESVEEMQAYHGSPLNFKRFGEKYIITHYCGWGTYVTNSINTGRYYATRNGYLYEVSIPDNDGKNYLNYNEVTPEKCDLVYSILAKAYPDYSAEIKSAIEKAKECHCFVPIFNQCGIEGVPATSKDISKTFLKNGIIGIQMEDTYILFDAKLVKIIKKTQMAESVFANEEDMKKKILNGPDGDVYKKRGGINEEVEGASIGGSTGGDFVGSETGREDVGFDTALGMVEKKPIGGRPKEKKNDNGVKPENVLGKTITAESKKSRKIYITEEQLKSILREEFGGATTTTQVASGTDNGMLGYPRPEKQFTGSNGKKGDKFWGPAMERKPGFSMKRVGEGK